VLSAQADHQRPWVIDADALTLLAELKHQDGLPAWWTDSSQVYAVLTPHPGEAARLLGCSTQEIEADRFAAARALSEQYTAIVALKGAGTIIDNGRQSWVCSLGNPGMASGGMGDVLSGLIGGLLAQGLSPQRACILGVWLHSRAADLAHLKYDDRALLASDLFTTLAHALCELHP
jgi:NAD(P)H-hydrate epimerase